VRGVPRTESYPHGTRARHKHDGCPCPPCRAANAAYERRRRRRNAYGRNPLVDAEPVSRHVRALMAPYPGSGEGVGWKRVAKLAGVSEGVVRGLLYGNTGREPTRRIHRENAEKILRLTLAARERLKAPGAVVPSGPTEELAGCMARFGIGKARMGRALGTAYRGVRFGPSITVRKADDVANLHWKLFEEEPEFRRRCECPLPREVEAWLLGEAS
jgi:hypothetical protein